MGERQVEKAWIGFADVFPGTAARHRRLCRSFLFPLFRHPSPTLTPPSCISHAYIPNTGRMARGGSTHSQPNQQLALGLVNQRRPNEPYNELYFYHFSPFIQHFRVIQYLCRPFVAIFFVTFSSVVHLLNNLN